MLTGVVVFLLVLISLLAIPITLTFKASWRQDFVSDIRLHWLFGLVHVRFHSTKSHISSKPVSSTGEQAQQKSARKKSKARKKAHVLAAIQKRKFRQRIIRFINDIWHAVYKRDLILRMRVGLGDPADTGQLWAFVGPVTGMLANVQAASITIEPEFMEPTFEFDGSGSIRIIPLQLIILTLALLLSPPAWQGIRQMRPVSD